MLTSLFWSFRYAARRLWVRAALISLLAVVAAAMAPFLAGILPPAFRDRIDGVALASILSILTNSMLAVTTFSLSIMVTAHLSADKGVTPRSHRLLQEDGRTQTVLATFLGAFVYALVLTVMQNAGVIDDDDMAVVYLVSVGVIIFIVIAILRWIAHLDGLGSLEETSRRVEERATSAIEAMNGRPFLGGRALDDPASQIPGSVHTVHARQPGYVQQIDVKALSNHLEPWAGRAFLRAQPGDWVSRGDPIVLVEAEDFDEERESAVLGTVRIGDVRVFEQDMTFSLIVLAEIAERALSPGINDPRTAIDIITRLSRLIDGIEPERTIGEPDHRNVLVPPVKFNRTLMETLDPIARDGRTFTEVQIAAQRAYALLEDHPVAEISAGARVLSRRALAYAREGLLLEEDFRRVTRAAIASWPAPEIADGADAHPAAPGGNGSENHRREDG